MFNVAATRNLIRPRSHFSIVRRALSSSSTSGRVAVVTGAAKARGIGRAIALRLAKDGYDIAISDLPSKESHLHELSGLISQLGRRAFVFPADVAVESDVRELVGSTAESLGSVDVMVANAGICVIKPLMNTTVEEWNRAFSINARGVFLCYKYAAEQMIKQGNGGRLIGASSIAGKKGTPGGSAYCGSKFAIRGLTQTAAQELAPHGITANTYAPGAIDTDMLDFAIKRTNIVDKEKYLSPLGFLGTPDDIAGLVSYLASPEARFITGQSISIDGGIVFD